MQNCKHLKACLGVSCQVPVPGARASGETWSLLQYSCPDKNLARLCKDKHLFLELARLFIVALSKDKA